MASCQSLKQKTLVCLKPHKCAEDCTSRSIILCIFMPRHCQHVSNIFVSHNEPSLFSVICYILLSVEYECSTK